MDTTPRGVRPHIAIFGRRNVGKSSLINALAGQKIALVSEVAGTTTDPVYKNMELIPYGPVVLIDTAGLDDEGNLGRLRVEATRQVLYKTDLALVVLEPSDHLEQCEKELLDYLQKAKIQFIIVINKLDLKQPPKTLLSEISIYKTDVAYVSTQSLDGIENLRTEIIPKKLKDFDTGFIIRDLVKEGDVVILVIPVDTEAPKGRLILPQVQTIRELLDSSCICIAVKDTELKDAISILNKPPKLVVTDSQAFHKVAQIVPENIAFTSFSILFARFKGDLEIYIKGIEAVKNLKPNAKILIAESCTHNILGEDIGRVKIPRLLRQRFGDKLEFEFIQGSKVPENLSIYDLVVQCGGCMVNRKTIMSLIERCNQQNIPITNYGLLIAYLNGILEKALKPLQVNLV